MSPPLIRVLTTQIGLADRIVSPHHFPQIVREKGQKATTKVISPRVTKSCIFKRFLYGQAVPLLGLLVLVIGFKCKHRENIYDEQ